jgi:hypothetical protein
MKRTLATFAGALLASTIMAAPAIAQDQSGDQGATGQTEELLPKKNQPGATTGEGMQGGAEGTVQGQTEMKPGQAETEGQTQTGQTEMKPGQAETEGQTQTGQTEMKPGQAETEGQTQTGQTEVKPGQTETEGTGQTQTGQTETAPSGETTGSINITAEQQTELKQVITTTKVEPATVDIDVNVGVAVPKTVVLHELPPRVIELVPAYKGYKYFLLADGRIIIVEPSTLEIVYIIV